MHFIRFWAETRILRYSRPRFAFKCVSRDSVTRNKLHGIHGFFKTETRTSDRLFGIRLLAEKHIFGYFETRFASKCVLSDLGLGTCCRGFKVV